ncbi:Multidrug resistance protein MdtC [Planktothrix tepida]|uniref:Cation/multidrug efflux pump n=1 Tax=Planktothrix tepida PCC 9214 TaxID=671072 RepID=A0A1J1LS49_9CYAN|nr:efflux RND transporter permease subunit [Planktothrix tepida]CAD5959996.1 Multidrug resistance protein MdtC [Planktothrix tepida]CUR34676.1 Cation/multidrug efflux pump [Planktothrix tepida PCC 9214]
MIQSPLKPAIRERFNISRISIAHPRIVIGFWIGVIVAGMLAFGSLKYALFPEVTFPVVVVSTTAPISTATDMELKVTLPIENQVKSIEGVYDFRSSTYPGRSIISLAFLVGTSLESSTNQVETTLKTIQLPAKTTYTVIPLNLNESTAITYAIQSQSLTLKELTELTKTEIIPQLNALPGVLKVNLLGDGLTRKGTSDIASLSSSQTLIQDPPILVRYNGENVLAVQVIKRSDANTLEVVDRVETAINSIQEKLQNVKLNLAETQADYIRKATHSTIEELLLAIILAIAIVFPFLRNLRATFITALAIPTSLLGTCIVMAIAGFNLETITLLALALVIGIVIDDAIVDVENIARLIDAGENPRDAALKGTDEIGLTVTASTLTIVAVFLPVAFMGDALGQFFKPFALTISSAVLISLLVARTLSPVLAVYWLKPIQNKPENYHPQPNLIIETYRRLLQWSLHHRKLVILIAILSFIAGLALIPLVPQGFLPRLDRGEFVINYSYPLPQISNFKLQNNSQTQETPTDTPTGETDVFKQPGAFNWLTDLARNPIQLFLRKTRTTGNKIEQVVLNTPDVEEAFTIIGIKGQPNKGRIYVKLKNDRQLTTLEAQDQIRENLPSLNNVTVSVEDLQFVETGDEKPLQIVLVGDDVNLLKKTAKTLQEKVAKLPGFVDVRATGEENTSNDINQIERFNGQRAAYVTANLSQGQLLGDATNQVLNIAQPLIPNGVTLKLTGDSARIGQVLNSFLVTLLFSVVCMLGLLFLLFGRWVEPAVVGLTLPLCLVGAMLALLVTQSAFGIISLIGLIFLLGLLDKNVLLLMDYINQLRQKGMNRNDAIIETGVVRLRPIIMTTASTILGMLPIALGLGAGAELRQPMAVAIIGGLMTSTLLSLIVVPVLNTLLEDEWLKIKQRFKS